MGQIWALSVDPQMVYVHNETAPKRYCMTLANSQLKPKFKIRSSKPLPNCALPIKYPEGHILRKLNLGVYVLAYTCVLSVKVLL